MVKMSKKRTLDSKIRSSQTFFQLSYRQRDLWHGLIAIADDQGRLPGVTAYVRSQVWPYEDPPVDEIEGDLKKLEELRMIYRYEIDGQIYIQLVNWWKYQSPQWAGASDYPSPDGWLDRERYHGKEHTIITNNWNTPGGFCDNQQGGEQPDEPKPPDKPGEKLGDFQEENQVLREEEVKDKDKEKDKDEVKDEENANGADLDGRLAEICQHFESNITMLTPALRSKVIDWQGTYPHDWIMAAINIAAENSKRRASYVEGILENWRVDGKDDGKGKGKRDYREGATAADRRRYADAVERYK
jgi:DnaD/phage-associated family protein